MNCRKDVRSQDPMGMGKPFLGRSMMASGRTPRMAVRNSVFPPFPWTFAAYGSVAANSTSL